MEKKEKILQLKKRFSEEEKLDENSPDTILLRIRLPNGSNIQRRFRTTETIEVSGFWVVP